ncbi:MAG: hypothetical protein R6V46_14210 [Desulfatiglandaceae bacterium]
MPCIPLEIIIIIAVFGVTVWFITREPEKSEKSPLKTESYRVDVNVVLDAKPSFSDFMDSFSEVDSDFGSVACFRESDDSMKEQSTQSMEVIRHV